MPGSMNKNHLTSALLMQIQGGRTLPKSQVDLSFDLGSDSQQLALTRGVLCITWSWSDVQANLEDFRLLMASDNKDAETSMTDSELHVIADVIGEIAAHNMILGSTLDGTLTIYSIKHASSSWDSADLHLFIDFSKEFASRKFDFVLLVANWLCQSARFAVPTKLFRLILKNTKPVHQWVRALWVIRLYGADWVKGCYQFKNKYAPKEILLTFSKMNSWRPSEVTSLNNFLNDMMEAYWYVPNVYLSKYAQKALHALGNLLVKIGKCIVKSNSYKEVAAAQTVYEFEVRAKLVVPICHRLSARNL